MAALLTLITVLAQVAPAIRSVASKASTANTALLTRYGPDVGSDSVNFPVPTSGRTLRPNRSGSGGCTTSRNQGLQFGGVSTADVGRSVPEVPMEPFRCVALMLRFFRPLPEVWVGACPLSAGVPAGAGSGQPTKLGSASQGE